MALTNNIIQRYQTLGDYTPQTISVPSTLPGAVAAYSGGLSSALGVYPSRKWTIKLADIVGLGAYVTGDIILESLPPGSCVSRTLVRASTAVTGLTTCVGYVKTSGANFGTTTFDLKAAVSATNHDIATPTANIVSMTAATNLLFHMISTVDNLSAATAGQIDVWVDYITFSI